MLWFTYKNAKNVDDGMQNISRTSKTEQYTADTLCCPETFFYYYYSIMVFIFTHSTTPPKSIL